MLFRNEKTEDKIARLKKQLDNLTDPTMRDFVESQIKEAEEKLQRTTNIYQRGRKRLEFDDDDEQIVGAPPAACSSPAKPFNKEEDDDHNDDDQNQYSAAPIMSR